MDSRPKYSSTFIFETKNLTDEFDRLDSEIARRARRIPGFLGEEAWHNDDTGLHAEVYYWTDMAALRRLSVPAATMGGWSTAHFWNR